ncbi:TPA: hypothetical protein QCY08_002907 [Bacillus paranthracis]|nr:hypothetical protein [Bacillus paranthracis]
MDQFVKDTINLFRNIICLFNEKGELKQNYRETKSSAIKQIYITSFYLIEDLYNPEQFYECCSDILEWIESVGTNNCELEKIKKIVKTLDATKVPFKATQQEYKVYVIDLFGNKHHEYKTNQVEVAISNYRKRICKCKPIKLHDMSVDLESMVLDKTSVETTDYTYKKDGQTQKVKMREVVLELSIK